MPRKTDWQVIGESRSYVASMRPRPDAAENVAGCHQRLHRRGASMRPRPDAAENVGDAIYIDAAGVLQ